MIRIFRSEEILNAIAPLWEERLNGSMGRIQDCFSLHQGEIVKGFCSHIIPTVIKEIGELQKQGGIGEVSSVAVSYLYSSIATRSYDYEISFFSQEPFTDPCGRSAYWRPQFLFQFVDQDEAFIKKELSKRFIRVQGCEAGLVAEELLKSYWGRAAPFFKILVEELKEQEEFRKLRIKDTVTTFYGEHMGEWKEI